jgi:hypothetical protein
MAVASNVHVYPKQACSEQVNVSEYFSAFIGLVDLLGFLLYGDTSNVRFYD